MRETVVSNYHSLDGDVEIHLLRIPYVYFSTETKSDDRTRYVNKAVATTTIGPRSRHQYYNT